MVPLNVKIIASSRRSQTFRLRELGGDDTNFPNAKVELSVAEAILDEISSRMEYISLARRSIDLTILRTDKALRDTQVDLISKGHDSIDPRY